MFRTLNRLILCLAVVCLAAQAGRAGLVGHWKLDDGSGTVAADATGNGRNGTLLNGPTWVEGYLGGALKFAGNSQKVDIPYSAALNPIDEFTISVWANVDPTGTSHRSPITSRDDYPQRGYILYVEPGNTWQFWSGTGAGWHTTAGPAVTFDEWTLVTASYAGGQKKLYINGSLAAENAAAFGPNTQQVLRIGGGATESAGNYFFVGMIDDVRVYNHAVSELELDYLVEGKPYPFASSLAPKNGAMTTTGQVTLQWTPGELATSHNVYFGEDQEAVANATPDDADLFRGSTTATTLAVTGAGTQYPTGLTPGMTYYWRVDEINDDNPESPWKGQVWSFWVQPLTAYNPSPVDGSEYILLDQDLSWSPGQKPLFYTVYLAESFEAAQTATQSISMTTSATCDPGPLAPDTTYYWRVDTFTVGSITQKGPVWSFRTVPEIPVADESLLAWWKLDEGSGNNVLDWSGHGHHGTLGGNPQWVGGYAGGALSFDGQDDYVAFGTPADLYLPQTYSYCVRFKVANNVFDNIGTQYLLCIGSRSDLIIGVEDSVGLSGDLMLHYYDTTPAFNAVGVGQVVWSSDNWHMVVATKDATGHKIYLDGELKNSDTNTNNDNYATTRIISLAARAWTSPQVDFFNGLLDDVRIYNRALSAAEIGALLVADPLQASEPNPVRDATVDIRDLDALTWTAGDSAVSHDVYFGAERSAVAAAGKDAAEFQGNQSGTSFSPADLVTFGGGSYYWRIDEVEADGTVRTGDVWKFTVPAYLLIDDFESYTDDEANEMTIYHTWVDGFTDQLSNSIVGYMNSAGGTFGERTIVHGGGQSMPLEYDDSKSPYFSEATRTWASAQDWTAEDVDTLTLFFRGAAGNAADPLYVVLKDSASKTASVVHGDPQAMRTARWTEWNIPLSEFGGLSLNRIKTLCVGLGDRTGKTPGGTGLIYIDDIRLTRTQQ
ncbi:MAG TPA: LamG domain-containing protein [Sedimentisphaerales bacterium]|jgi:hypothetical protein|nr:LamG domain-containing protein [Sedimentisphaerales bacterium]HNU28044.1 LamG domain-containing protein [Sedimentisphaerales bacterium]